jgi:hypothetical protein
MNRVTRVACHWSTAMGLMAVMEVVVVSHRLMVIIDHNRVDTVVDTVVTHVP